MAAHIAQLALLDSDRQRRKSLFAVPSLRIRVAASSGDGEGDGVEEEEEDGEEAAERLDQRTREKLGALVNECLYDWTVIMPNFDPRLGRFAPPTGYVACMHEDTTFRLDMIDRNIFRGLAVADLAPSTGRFSDEEIRDALARMNQMVRDVSPMPYQGPGAAGNEWVCALGPNAWLGAYEKRHGSVVTYALGVVAGLEDGAFDSMWSRLQSQYHCKRSVKDADAEVLEAYRASAAENRARLLASLLALLEASRGAEVLCSRGPPRVPYARDPAPEQTIPDMAWAWLPPAPFRVPIWYAFPSRSPRGCAEMPYGLACYQVGAKMTEDEVTARGERCPASLVPSLDIALDDIKPYARAMQEHYVRYANCSESSAAVRGPLHPIRVRTKAPPSAATYHAFPAAACRTPAPAAAPLSVPHTWEDADIPASVVVAGVAYGELHLRGEEGGIVSYYPVFVRVSCRDEYGQTCCAGRPDEADHRRMSGFCGDDWIGL